MKQPLEIDSRGRLYEVKYKRFSPAERKVYIDLYNSGKISWRTVERVIFPPTS